MYFRKYITIRKEKIKPLRISLEIITLISLIVFCSQIHNIVFS